MYCRLLLFYYYRVLTGVYNKPHLRALQDPLLNPRKHLVERAGRQWTGNTITLKGALVRMVDYWAHLPGTAGIDCPVKFEEQEREEFLKQEDMWFCFNALVGHWRDQLGVSEDGWVSNENYAAAMQGAKDLKEDIISKADNDEEDIALIIQGCPFDDHEDVDVCN